MEIRFPLSPRSRTFAALAVTLGLLTAGSSAADSITYTYDSLGRLASTYDATTGVTVTYAYDLNGNRMVQAITTDSAAGVWGSMTWGTGTWGG